MLGSSPTLGRVSLWNMIPVFARKHCRIIQRRGIRARLLRVPLTTEPPPISAYIDMSIISLNSINRTHVPQWQPANHTSSTSVTVSSSENWCSRWLSRPPWVRWVWTEWPLLRGISWLLIPFLWSWCVGRYHVLGLKRLVYDNEKPFLKKNRITKEISTHTRCSSRDIAWRKYLILLSTWVNGNRRGINPTESTVSLTSFAHLAQVRWYGETDQIPTILRQTRSQRWLRMPAWKPCSVSNPSRRC